MNNNQTPEISRDKVIIQTSVIGILTNVFLVVFKSAVGVLSNSIAVVLDAVNNLADALSSIITIVGTKLSSKLPDKKHPLGYGRIEYLTAMIIAGIVLFAGLTSAVESVKKIIHPEKPDYSLVALLIISVAVVVKVFLGSFMKARGMKVNSGSLVASGSDSLNDAILSGSVLACAVIFKLTGLSLEPYVGLVISAFIIKSGIEIMRETLDHILGTRADKAITDKIVAIMVSEPHVYGAYDLILHNYGPDRNLGSVHVELPDTMTVLELDRLTRKLEAKVYRETGVILTAVGVYALNTGNGEAARLQNEVRSRVLAHDWALQFHGFYVDTVKKEMQFDVVMSFDIPSKEGLNTLYEEMRRAYPGYTISIAPDVDVSVTE